MVEEQMKINIKQTSTRFDHRSFVIKVLDN